MKISSAGHDRLTSDREEDQSPLNRQHSYYNPLQSFELAKGKEKHYQQQYGDMYFLRLAKLKPVVEQIAAEAWEDIQVGISTLPLTLA